MVARVGRELVGLATLQRAGAVLDAHGVAVVRVSVPLVLVGTPAAVVAGHQPIRGLLMSYYRPYPPGEGPAVEVEFDGHWWPGFLDAWSRFADGKWHGFVDVHVGQVHHKTSVPAERIRRRD